MSLFVCDNCGIVDNTALTNFWSQAEGEKRCSACDKDSPSGGVWHGRFPPRTMQESGYVFLKRKPFVGKPEWENP